MNEHYKESYIQVPFVTTCWQYDGELCEGVEVRYGRHYVGDHRVYPGDWVIKNSSKRYSMCPGDEFEWRWKRFTDHPRQNYGDVPCRCCEERSRLVQKLYETDEARQRYIKTLEQALDEAQYKARVQPIKPGTYVEISVIKTIGDSVDVVTTSGDRLLINKSNLVYVPDTGKVEG